MAVEPVRRLFTVDDLHRMARAGIFDENDRVELIDGEIFEMPPMDPPHAGGVNRVNRLLVAKNLYDLASVGVQSPVVLDDLTEPQPDLWVARMRHDDYTSGHPRPGDLFVVIEIADSSAALDRRWKVPRYGRDGVPEAWLVDLRSDRLEVSRSPGPDGYADVTILQRGQTVSPAAFPDLTLHVEDILGPQPA